MKNKILKLIKKPSLLFLSLGHRGFFNWMDDDTYLKIAYKIKLGSKLNLENPLTFNEKLQWLKIHDRNPLYTKLVDKYEVKKYVADKIGEQYIIPTYGVWDRFDDIDFNSLPSKFVLKCTHDSGGIVIVPNKDNLDIKSAKKKLEESLCHNYYWGQREWPYKNVKPRIIAEKYMEDSNDSKELVDYKLMCFNSKVKCSFTCTNRGSKDGLKVTFFDTEWNRMPFIRHYPADISCMDKPKSYDEMIVLAEKLSEKIPFARIDFYEIHDRPYFGEITLFPGSGMEEFDPSDWDLELGKWIDLPNKEGKLLFTKGGNSDKVPKRK